MRTQRKKNRWGILFGFVLFPLHIVCALALLPSYLSVFTDPAKYGIIAFFGLYFSLIVILNLLLIVVGLLRHSRIAWINFVCLLPGLLFANRFVKLGPPENFAGEREIRIATYNIFNFDMPDDGAPDKFSVQQRLARQVGEAGIDILCMQEFCTRDTLRTLAIFEDFPYHYFYFPRYNRYHYYGNVIFSRFPLSHGGRILFKGGYKSCVYARVHIDGQDGRAAQFTLINTHLQSTSVSLVGLAQRLYAKKLGQEDIKKAHVKMNTAFEMRSAQIHQLTELIEKASLPLVLCGDFNDTPVSYTYQEIKKTGLDDSFCEAGRGLGASYRHLSPLLRIDYLFSSSGIDAIEYRSPRWDYSDHYPVIACFNLSDSLYAPHSL